MRDTRAVPASPAPGTAVVAPVTGSMRNSPGPSLGTTSSAFPSGVQSARNQPCEFGTGVMAPVAWVRSTMEPGVTTVSPSRRSLRVAARVRPSGL